MRRYFELIVRHRRKVVFFLLAIMILFAAGLPRLRFDNRPDSFFPPGHPAFVSKRTIEETFGLEDPMLFGVITRRPDGIYSEAPLRLLERLTREIEAILSTFPDAPAHAVYSLSTERNVELVGGILQEMPFLEPFPRTEKDFLALADAVRRIELYSGTIVSKDGSAGGIIIVPPRGKAEDVYERVSGLARNVHVDGIEIALAGEAAVRSAMGRAVAHDALRLNPLCVLVISAFLYLAFRNVTGVLLPLLVVGWGSVVMLGLMAFAGSPIYIITNAILVTVVSLGVADAIHVQGEYYRELGRGEFRDAADLVVRANTRLWAPVFYTSITDVAGFLSFYLTGSMPPLEQFGIFTAVGCGATLVASMSLLPACLAMLDPTSPRHAKRRDWAVSGPILRGLAATGDFLRRRFRPVSIASAIVIVLLAAGATRLRVGQSMVSAFDEGHEIVRADAVLNELFDGTYFLDVFIEAKEAGGLCEPRALRSIEELEEAAKKLPHVKGSISIAGFSRKLNQILHDWDPKEHRIPDDAATAREQFALLDASPSKKADFLRTVDPTYTRANVRLRLSTGRFADERVVVEALERHVAEKFPESGPLRATLSGRVNMDCAWVHLIVRSHIASVACSLVLVFLLLYPMFRSALASFYCVLPVGVAILATYATMGLLHIELGIGTSMFASLAMGVGVNFPIHVLDRLRHTILIEGRSEEEAFRDGFAVAGKALLFNGLSICLGFLALIVSDLPILRHFGLMIATGIGAACLSSLTALPALVAWARPSFIYGRATAHASETPSQKIQ